MTATHADPLYRQNSRIVRQQVTARLKTGGQVMCIGCGSPIHPGQRFDVGHIIDAARGGSHDLSNLGPQHYRENRSAGGRLGAARTHTNSRRARRLPIY